MIVIELLLMEIGDPFMMRKCLLGIKRRAEMLAADRPGEAMPGRPDRPEVVVAAGHRGEATAHKGAANA